MSATVEKLSSNQVKLTVTVSAQDFEQAMNAAYGKLKGRLTVPGFRKGKAPRKIIENYYGAGVLVEEAFNTVLPDSYDKAVEETGIKPVAQPEIDLETIGAGEDCVYTATVYVRPEVTLGQYKGIAVPAAKWEVKPEQVQAEIDRAAERVSRMVEVTDRAAQDGDTTNINYAGSVDGVAFAGGTAENQNLVLGSGMFIPGFEDQVVGMNIGEERDINVTFPEEYQAKELAGKAAVFHVKLNSISYKEMPEINDDFAKDVSEFDTLDEYKADIEKRIGEQEKNAAEQDRTDKIIEKVCENATVDIPQPMVERAIDQRVNEMNMRMSYQGLKMEDFLKYTGQTMEQLRLSYADAARKQVLAEVVLDAIRAAEGIDATAEEVDAEIAKYAESAEKSVEDIKATLSAGDMEYFTEMVKTQKTIDLVVAAAVDAPEEEPAKDAE
ncbi:MAG: trigger factor [Candidatus Spyradocola sp.]|nr:trigger factor [Candidatus Spyradocola sp.]